MISFVTARVHSESMDGSAMAHSALESDDARRAKASDPTDDDAVDGDVPIVFVSLRVIIVM